MKNELVYKNKDVHKLYLRLCKVKTKLTKHLRDSWPAFSEMLDEKARSRLYHEDMRGQLYNQLHAVDTIYIQEFIIPSIHA